ncbi:hypothetical protein EOD10_06975 [Mesorhizobium sp. M7A.T.Ca.TU.009.01.3.2]|nr:hypothetical protein EOD10_06975 [Mesorhizobium sp. M7A.T.Ca.TU.009.01.3.2]RUV01787.1 hypothetical protein EOD00_22800 [Mesorhizobium sp. M7A.T.Ca.TU.009.01.3.1]
MNLEAETSQALLARLADLQAKMREGRKAKVDMRTSQNVAADEDRSQIDGDNLKARVNRTTPLS